jgi:hypothetical protein
LLFGIGLDGHGEHLALLAAIDRLDRSAHGRGEQHALVVLVEEQRSTRLHLISYFHQQLRSYTFKIERRNGIRVGQRGVDHHGGRLTFEFDVETFVQFNDFRHV